ncbi:hypothetical protein M0R45_010059 [Rubus argutus]|uniref:Uncharacterized protein n=1 Tax=Rubus argutus TaxID=59490 RepID=A0AAW1Y6P0_RUBAR
MVVEAYGKVGWKFLVSGALSLAWLRGYQLRPRFRKYLAMFEFTQACGIATVMRQIQAMAEDAQPLLAEVHDSGLLKEVESLTKSLMQASEDLR